MTERAAADVVLCPGGPMLVRGARHVVDADGTRHPVDRPVVAVCRCELSATLPWCDATHKRLPDERRPR
ncbi:CDGSH iron-sulfur domain-containing protein [Nocardioides sp.]|uniref:CDGSH iron-sulfur domain-containing protein n=1 Tax=Nocardioides sp. TaxID=35761 RepID=UPI002ED16D8E